MVKAFRPQVFLGWTLLLLWGISFAPAAEQTDEAAIRRYSREAEQALEEKRPDAAAAALEKLAHLTPNVAEVHANLGMVYYAQGQYRKAGEAFLRAFQLNPRIADAEVMLGLCYAQTGRPEEASPILYPAFRHPPNRETGRAIGLQLLRTYTALGQYDKLFEISEEMLGRYPNDPEILYRASRLHADRSLQVMLRLVDVAPNSAWKRMAFGEVQEAQKRYDLAIIEYRNALKTDPRIPGLHFHVGRAILLNAKDSEAARNEAMQEFQQELAIDPENPDAEYEIGELQRERGRLEQAGEHFLRAIQNDPNFVEAQIALARTFVDLRKPREALPHLLVAVRLDPANEVSHFLLARVYETLGDATQHRAEMELFQKYHALTNPIQPGAREELPAVLTTPNVTRQSLDSQSQLKP